MSSLYFTLLFFHLIHLELMNFRNIYLKKTFIQINSNVFLFFKKKVQLNVLFTVHKIVVDIFHLLNHIKLV